jgi:hypothetical protein
MLAEKFINRLRKDLMCDEGRIFLVRDHDPTDAFSTAIGVERV